MTSIRQRKHMIALKFSFGELPLWIILVFCSIGCSHAEMSTPINHAAQKGATVQLNCSLTPYKNPIIWYSRTVASSGEDLLYDDGFYGDVRPLYSVDESVNGSLPLTIKELSENTSGRYSCKPDSAGQKYGAQVIMLDASPICSKEMTASSVKANCSIGFSGYWTPKLEWRNAKGEPIKDGSSNPPTNSRVTSSVTLELETTDPSKPYNLTCTPKFTAENKPDKTTAENIPVFPYSCSVSNEPKPTDKPPVDTELPKPPKPPKTTPTQTGAPAVDGGPTSSTTSSSSVSAYEGHNQYLHFCLVTLIFIGMLHKWLWAMTEEDKV